MRRIPWIALVTLAAIGAAVWWWNSAGSTSDPASAPRSSSLAVPGRDQAESAASELLADARADDQSRSVVHSAAPDVSPQSTASTPDTPGQALTVRVVSSSDGRALAGVRVRVSPPGLRRYSWETVGAKRGNLTRAPVTDQVGLAEFDVPHDVALNVEADGESDEVGSFRERIQPLIRGEQRSIVLEVPTNPDMRFHGVLVDCESGLPVPHATVTACRSIGSRQDADGAWAPSTRDLVEVRSDSAGRFEMRLSSWTRPFLRIQSSEHGPALALPASDHGSPDRAQVIRLSRAATLRAQVVDGAGQPIQEASVRLRADGFALLAEEQEGVSGSSPHLPAEIWNGELDASGRCTIAGLPANVPLSVQIRQGTEVLRKEPDAIRLQPGEIAERRWTVGSGGRIEGQVVDQDMQPVRSHAIWLLEREWEGEQYIEMHAAGSAIKKATTDKHGRFSLEDVPLGHWWLCTAPTRSYGDPPSADAIAAKTQSVLVESTGTKEVLLEVVRGLYIRGSVVDPVGKPEGRTNVSGQPSAASTWLQTSTNEQGEFALGPLVPGPCRLWADGSGSFAASDPVTAEAGQAGIVLQRKAGGGLSGLVVDALSGEPCGASIYVQPHHPIDTSMGAGFSTELGSEGKFDLTGLVPDLYDVFLATPDGRFGVLTDIPVVAGKDSTGHVVSVSPGGKLELLYEAESGHAQVTVRMGRVAAGWPDWLAAGEPFVRPAPAGNLIVEYTLVEGTVSSELKRVPVHLAPGETRTVVLPAR